MAKLLKMISRVGPACVMVFLVACSTADSPATPMREASGMPAATPSREASASPATTPTQQTGELPAWIVNPPTLPPGRVGKNNCKFAFGLDTPKWDVHPDAGCWEHAGPDGWTRQQFQKIHVPSMPQCGGRPGDATAIRVCRAGGAGQPSPCFIDKTTGPRGCARCVVNPECH
jgi:hypothetical protein